MNLYELTQIENQIEQIAILNEGEIPEEELQKLVEAQTQSLIQIENLVHYIKHLEYFQETAKKEEERIKNLRQKAEKRVDSIKKYLTPYIQSKSKLDVGTFKLSVRRSESVEVDEDFVEKSDPEYINYKEIISKTPDKIKIKKALEIGEIVPGARLKENFNLQIK